MQFKNPQNGYLEAVQTAWLWCLLFGSVYFISKGAWTHAVMWLLLTPITGGIAWVVYPFFARQAIATNYRRMGWIEVNA